MKLTNRTALFIVFLALFIFTNLTSNKVDLKIKTVNNTKVAYFASGCFWCVEAIFESVIGVENVVSGYAGGFTKNPTYETSNTGKTGHAETVAVYYNPKKINFKTLVDVYFG